MEFPVVCARDRIGGTDQGPVLPTGVLSCLAASSGMGTHGTGGFLPEAAARSATSMSRPDRNRGSPRGARSTAPAARWSSFWASQQHASRDSVLAMLRSMSNLAARRWRTGLPGPPCLRLWPVHWHLRYRWVLGSIVIGVLVSVSPRGLVAVSVASELAAVPLILLVGKRTGSAWYPRAVTQRGSRSMRDTRTRVDSFCLFRRDRRRVGKWRSFMLVGVPARTSQCSVGSPVARLCLADLVPDLMVANFSQKLQGTMSGSAARLRRFLHDASADQGMAARWGDQR